MCEMFCGKHVRLLWVGGAGERKGGLLICGTLLHLLRDPSSSSSGKFSAAEAMLQCDDWPLYVYALPAISRIRG